MFPPEIVPPTFRWEDTNPQADCWSLEVEFTTSATPGQPSVEKLQCVVDARRWTPTDAQWEAIKGGSVDEPGASR